MRVHKHKNWGVLYVMILFLVVAQGLEWYYYGDSIAHIPMTYLQSVYTKKAKKAEKGLDILKQKVPLKEWNNIQARLDKDIYFYVVDSHNKLVYWSSNELDVSELQYCDHGEEFVTLGHAKGILVQRIYESYSLVSFVKIKDEYDSENEYIYDTYAKGFWVNQQVKLRHSDSYSESTIVDQKGAPLFAFVWTTTYLQKRFLGQMSLIFWILFYITLLFSISMWHRWLGGNMHKLYFFLAGVFVYSILIYLSMQFKYPRIVYATDLFSPYYYSSAHLNFSLGHLLVIGSFVFSVVLVFYWHVYLPILRTPKYSHWVYVSITQVLFLILFIIECWIVQDFIYNSVVEVSLSRVDLLSVESIFFYIFIIFELSVFILMRDKILGTIKYSIPFFLFLSTDIIISLCIAFFFLGIGKSLLFIYTIGYGVFLVVIDSIRYYRPRIIRFYHIIIIVLVSTAFQTFIIQYQSNTHRHQQYKVLAEKNLSEGESYDVLTQKLLEDLEPQIQEDRSLAYFMRMYRINQSRILDYMLKYYFYGYWDCYDVKIYATYQKNSKVYQRYEKLKRENQLFAYTSKHFYTCSEMGLMDYLGIFEYSRNAHDSTYLFIELVKKNEFNQYGYPDVVFETGINNLTHLLSTANYLKGNLLRHTGEYHYPLTMPSITANDSIFYTNDYLHHLYKFDDHHTIVVSEKSNPQWLDFLVSWTYLFSLFVVLVFIVYFSSRHRDKRDSMPRTFFSSLLNSFILFVVVCMGVVFVVMIIFTINQYSLQQRKELRLKTNYVKTAVEDYIIEHDNQLEKSIDISYFVSRLSHKYQSDIHIYGVDGKLLATSRNSLFQHKYQSENMSSVPYFHRGKDVYIQTEKLGDLKYLSSYSEIYSSHGRLLGYISLPSFFSLQDMRHELLGFLAWILIIYFVILLFTSLVSYVISGQLTRPMRVLESKLKAIRLGRANEKIEYIQSDADEITNLIIQYNTMVDELSNSAKLLAESERQVAWREMARQIAHEIKNPLTPMKLSIQMLDRMKGRPDFDEYLKKTTRSLVEQIDSLAIIANEFSNFARMPVASFKKVDIVSKLMSSVNLFNNNSEGVVVDVECSISEAYVFADSEQLTQVFNNILKNAIQAIPDNREGLIEVKLYQQNDKIEITIRDNGEGIPPEVQEKLFIPTFTTKTSGMGLGLSIVKNIIQMSHGTINFKTEQGWGTTFIIQFPIV